MKRYSQQQKIKLFDKTCFFCGEDDYALLDAHRIVEGANKGTYARQNVLTVCSKCHRKIHSSRIKIDRKYFSTSGKWVVHCWIDGEERWM